MAASLSKIVIGTEPYVTRAMADWMLAEPDARPSPCIIDERRIECGDFGVCEAFNPKNTILFLAMGDSMLNRFRHLAYAYMEKTGFAMTSLLHPQSLVDPRATLKPNSWIGQGATIGAHGDCGPNLVLRAGAIVHEGAEIGSHVSIGENAKVNRHCRIGSCAVLGADVILREGTVLGAQSCITRPGIYGGSYPPGTYITDDFEAKIIS